MFRSVLIGCGPRGAGHANAYAATREIQLVGCCDVDAGKAAALAAAHDVPYHSPSLAETLERCRPDFVDVCTPAHVRLPVVRAALAAEPRALLIEKPLSCRPGEALELIELAEKAGTRLFVNHQLRHLPPVRRLRRLVAAGAIGDLTSIRCATKWSLLEQGTHLFDLVGAFTGDEGFEAVMAQAQGWERDPAMPASPEYVQGVIACASGLHAQFECGPRAPSWAGRANPWHQAGLELVGTAGHATWSINRGWTLITADGKQEELYEHEEFDDPTESRLLDELALATREGAPHESDVHTARQSLGVVLAAQSSALRRGWVRCDDWGADQDLLALRRSLTQTVAESHAQRLRRLSDVAPSRILHGLCVLGVADHLIGGAQPIRRLADLTGAHEETLLRLLRAATALDVVRGEHDGRWSLTEAGKVLSSTEPENLRAQFSDNDLFTCWTELTHTLRTGECTYTKVFGSPFFDRLSGTTDGRRNFHEHMFERAHSLYKPLLEVDVWPDDGVCVDVCGGTGGLLAQVLTARPELRGVLHDLPDVLELSPLPGEQAIGDRVELSSSDVFEAVPGGGDLYVLACVLHDWNDDEARAILASCRRAMPSSARLLVIERVLDPEGSDATIFSDLWMLVVAGGRERTRPEWETLLGEAGFALRTVHTAPEAELGLLECTPA
ncbi:methyltransferase [Amycolatopsis magusensis]|uniref:methyltransferase n=1 Tax=Amycolatopsis magusensis TaxID=882444 RepID=UPI0037B84F7F